jgi:hypothetical protein
MRHEDNKIMTREMEKKLVETLLLILAVALGVGVAAAGFSLATTAGIRSARELALPQYREIKISTKTDADDFNAPALLNEQTENVSLSLSALAAAGEVPYVTGGFIMEEQNYMLGNPMAKMGRDDGPPPEDNQNASTTTASGTEVKDSAGEPNTGNDENNDRKAQMEAAMAEAEAAMENEPEPQIEELHGYSVSSDFFSIRELYPEEGSLFTQEDMEKQRPLMVIGSEIANTLFEDGLAMGRKLQVFDKIYTISAILEPTGTDMDHKVFTPMQASTSLFQNGGMRGGFRGSSSLLYFSVEESSQLNQAADQLETWFNAEYGKGAVNIDIPRAEAVAAADRNGRLITLILFLALSGLLIASVNVSNILMGRALRRSKMVGILKALGASNKRIFMLFFEEALMIGIAGSILGVGLSLLMTNIMTNSMGLQAFSAAGVAGGILLALTITLLLTLFPAFQASQTEAANAMRNE